MLRWRSGLGVSGDGRRRAVDSVVCEDEAQRSANNLNRASQSVVDDEAGVPRPESLIPPIVVDAADRLDSPPFSSSFYSFGGILFSYTTSALILGLALLAGWTWRISLERQVVQDAPRRVRESATSETHFVGRITGRADCQWADPKTEAFDRDGVLLGRMYALTSGFLEITYDTGATVILQGPVTYEVESASGGYLSLGKLTARVEKRGEGREERGEGLTDHQPKTSNHQFLSPLSSLPSPLFAVRTPTAIVTDLGTEFGVEVDKSRTTKTHVFRGKVELRPTAGGSTENAQIIPMGENESVTVEAGRGPVVKVTRRADQSNAIGFVRQMPRRVPIKLFNTGQAIREGDPDPHWQLAAATTYPHFEPRPAVVTRVEPRFYLANDPARSQWISMLNGLPHLRNDVTYTFRTTFELVGMPPSTAVLQGRFIADNRVTAIRLNGKATTVPEQTTDAPFDKFYSLTINEGFVDGTNVLEIDVYNGSAREQSLKKEFGPMLLRVELNGSVNVAR